jgi:predicted ArsR family transcriptional regulator
MHSTKSEILALLKRSDGATVDELATSLSLAPMTVRQHLTALERDALVQSEEVRRPTGRPHYRYKLTGDGHRRTLDGHDRMLALLVEQAGLVEPILIVQASPAERRGRLFEAAAKALAERHREDVQALSGDERFDRVAAILQSHGGFAEWHRAGDAYEFRDFGCVYRATVGESGPCAWHETFLSALLNVPIRAADGVADCAVCCRYVIPVAMPAAMRQF